MATAAPPSSSSGVPSRPTYSCIRCADRKVKCDRQKPCSTCVKHNVDCLFHPPQPLRKRHKRVKDQILTERLRHYEALLQERGIDPSKSPDTPDSESSRASSHTVSAAPTEFQFASFLESDPRCINKTQVVHSQGRFKFVDK